MNICKVCGKKVSGSLFVYRKEWDAYWHYKCYEHDKRVNITLPVSVIRKIRDTMLDKSNKLSYEEEFLYVTRSI